MTANDIETALVAALPLELRAHAAALARLLAKVANGALSAEAIQTHLVTNPALAHAVQGLAGRTLDVGRARFTFGDIIIAGNVGTLQQITITGGTIQGSVIGTQIVINLPPPPTPFPSKAFADQKVDAARAKVQDWGARVASLGWDDHAWHLLGHALRLAHEAITYDRDYQRPWTLLADIYHRIGKKELARQSLATSYRLAAPGDNHPGDFYREVATNISSGYPFNDAGGLIRSPPPAWFENRYQRYWTL
jgi:hypothetical protein